MTTTLFKAPLKRTTLKACLLRPANLHTVRQEFKDGKITADQFREVETKEIKHE